MAALGARRSGTAVLRFHSAADVPRALITVQVLAALEHLSGPAAIVVDGSATSGPLSDSRELTRALAPKPPPAPAASLAAEPHPKASVKLPAKTEGK